MVNRQSSIVNSKLSHHELPTAAVVVSDDIDAGREGRGVCVNQHATGGVGRYGLDGGLLGGQRSDGGRSGSSHA